jgi:hypothetical protein
MVDVAPSPPPRASALAWSRAGVTWPAPVEYAVAVDRYLASCALSQASRRVYRISLATWAWPLADRPFPAGPRRRGAVPPVLPLSLLDGEDADRRLTAAVADRSRHADARTVNRELSALRSAIGWWLDMGWIGHDPTIGLDLLPAPCQSKAPLTDRQRAALFRIEASLREQAFWHLLHDSGAGASNALKLDAGAVDRAGRPTTAALVAAGPDGWRSDTSDLLRWLLSGRTLGPVFLAERRAAVSAARADVCPLTGRARMSYRRAAEIFTAATAPLDPKGNGWGLHQLRKPRCAAGDSAR